MKDKPLRALFGFLLGGVPPPAPRTRPRRPGCCAPQPSCAADQPEILTHFLASFVRLKSAANSLVSPESHFVLQAVVSSLQAYLLHPAAGRI